MNKMKKLRLLCVLLLVVLSLQGCKSPFWAYRVPVGQPNSVWSTKDNSIVFYVGNSLMDPIYGKMETADGSIEIQIQMSDLITMADFYYKENQIDPDVGHPVPFAYGHGKVISKKVYQVEISSEGEYFENGQILTFYRIEKGYKKTD